MKLELEKEKVRALAFSSDGEVLVTMSNRSSARPWSVKTMEMMQKPENTDYALTLWSAGESGLHITGGTEIGPSETAFDSRNEDLAAEVATAILAVENEWLEYWGRDLIWLP